MLNICRYFTNHELYELFQLDNPLESKTQQQLEQMHAHQRVTDTALDEHIAYLYSCRKFSNNNEFSHDTVCNRLKRFNYYEKKIDYTITFLSMETLCN